MITIKRSIYLSLAIVAFGFGALVAIILYYSHFTPNLEQLERIKPALITKVYDSEGNVIKEYYIQRRVIIPLDSMPNYLVNGLVATEDKNFYNHWGVDIIHGIVRSVFEIVVFHKKHGGSSITQQLARNLFLTQEKTISRKIKEAITAVQIEKTYTKKEILAFYLNQVNLGAAYGVEAASKRFYSKKAKDLTIDEAAIFIGMLKAPNSYRPDWHPKRSKKRRNVVLKLMYENGVITKKQYDLYKEKPISVHPYQEKKSEIAPYFVEEVRQYVQKKYGNNALYNKGLKIYTTLHADEQQVVQRSFDAHIKSYQKAMNATFYYKYIGSRGWKKWAQDSIKNWPKDSIFAHLEDVITPWINKISRMKSEDSLVKVQGSFMAIDNRTGAVRALIGGRNFEESEFDRVYAFRQPGSSFKPFVAMAAVKKGFTVASILLDQPIVILSEDKEEDDWRPKNYHGSFAGPVLLCDVISKSLNLASVNLLNKITPRYAVNEINRFGFKTKFEAVPALALGVFEMRLYDLVKGYSVFPNSGNMIKPYMVERIEDNEGNVLERHIQESKKIIEPDVAYITTDLLSNVIKRGTGFGAVAAGFIHPAGGKTGTTNQSTDTWFLGFTKQITCGAWVGTDIKRTLGKHSTGANTALPIWIDYMKYAHEDLPMEKFIAPSNVVFKNICSKSGKLARKSCPKIYYNEAFIAGTQPKDSCDVHIKKVKHIDKNDDIWGIEKSKTDKGLTF